MINGGFVLNGRIEMHMMLRLLIITKFIKGERL